MKISDQPLPENAGLDVHPDAMLKRPDLAVGIAYAVALWADIEARLEGLFLSTTGDEAALSAFRDLRGWDKRVKFFVKHVKAHQGENAAIAVKAVLATIAVPAKKRNEIAHGIWAICEGCTDDLVLLPQTTYLDITTDAKRAEALGSAQIELKNGVLAGARVVTSAHLLQLVNELGEARSVVHTFMIEKMPTIVHVHGREAIQSASDHPEVAARIRSAKAAKSRRRPEASAH